MDMACIAKLKGWCGVAVSARPSRRPLRGLLRVRRQMVVRSSHVIASEAKQSILSVCREMDCFASLAMTAGYDFAISRHGSPEVCIFVCSLSITEGAGKTGCSLHLRSRVQSARKTHTSIQVQRRHPAFPAQWLYGLLRALPGERLSCHRHPCEACFSGT